MYTVTAGKRTIANTQHHVSCRLCGGRSQGRHQWATAPRCIEGCEAANTPCHRLLPLAGPTVSQVPRCIEGSREAELDVANCKFVQTRFAKASERNRCVCCRRCRTACMQHAPDVCCTACGAAAVLTVLLARISTMHAQFYGGMRSAAAWRT